MPTAYYVSMGQAVSVTKLGENALVTGLTHDDLGQALTSCSAVALVNTESGAAGLFHFPAWDLGKTSAPETVRYKKILTDMADDIRPNQVHFGHGTGMQMIESYELPHEREKLERFVLSLSTGPQKPVNLHVPVGGTFCIKGAEGGNGFEIESEPFDDYSFALVDLNKKEKGQYTGYKVYGTPE